jgi:excisionase family DNA binding protein
MIEDDELLTVEEAAARCKIKPDLMRALIARKQVRIVRLGDRAIRISPSELKRYWEKKEKEPYVPFKLNRKPKATNNENNK